ncbi:hypothetical protein PybrP1_011359 [[Pythium] brassicae (nom. inval.)]|nr:hypothetical protein PybrP1_011359 [[Pythium] brassicae (nom. inval.)]
MNMPQPPRMNSPTMTEMLQFDMGTMTATSDFLSQLAEMSDFGADEESADSASGTVSASDAAAKNRNRGNYRCSKASARTHGGQSDGVCGEPKKGHVCPLVPTNFKCARCGLPKKTCTCMAPASRSIGVQVELDADMTTRALDLSLQGVVEFHKSVAAYPSPPSGSL